MVAESKVLISFGKRVRKLREETRLSKEAFAYEGGLDRMYISEIERGKRNIGLENVKVIANALGVSLSELFEEL